MKNYRWINMYTYEVFDTLLKAITTSIRDMKHYKQCRTIKNLNIRIEKI